MVFQLEEALERCGYDTDFLSPTSAKGNSSNARNKKIDDVSMNPEAYERRVRALSRPSPEPSVGQESRPQDSLREMSLSEEALMRRVKAMQQPSPTSKRGNQDNADEAVELMSTSLPHSTDEVLMTQKQWEMITEVKAQLLEDAWHREKQRTTKHEKDLAELGALRMDVQIPIWKLMQDFLKQQTELAQLNAELAAARTAKQRVDGQLQELQSSAAKVQDTLGQQREEALVKMCDLEAKLLQERNKSQAAAAVNLEQQHHTEELTKMVQNAEIAKDEAVQVAVEAAKATHTVEVSKLLNKITEQKGVIARYNGESLASSAKGLSFTSPSRRKQVSFKE